MKLGIVGLPNVGKSTLFNSLTKAGAESANYPFCTIDPNVGIVTVPDARVDYLAEKYHSKKVIPAAIDFTDICKELVSKTFPFGSSFHKTCDINEFDRCRDHFL